MSRLYRSTPETQLRNDNNPRKTKDISSSLTTGQCTALLDLAQMWGFEDVRVIAEKRIRTSCWASINSVDKISLALKYEMEDWYFDAYHELAIRESPLTAEEMQQLGWDVCSKMVKVREKVRETAGMNKSMERMGRKGNGRDFSFCKSEGETARDAIEKHFGVKAPVLVPRFSADTDCL